MIKISITKWETYNPRSDRSVHSWFRFQNNFFTDQKLFGISETDRLLFIFLLCEMSKNLGDAAMINPKFVATIMQKEESEIIKGLEQLSSLELITCDPLPPFGVTSAPNGNATNVTNERTNNTELLRNSSLPVAVKTAPAKKSSLIAFENAESLAAGIPNERVELWRKLYDQEYLNREIIKAFGYYVHDNPKKCPRNMNGWIRALSSWFERGWPKYVSQIKGEKPADENWNAIAIQVLDRVTKYQGEELQKSLGEWKDVVNKAGLQRIRAFPPGPYQVKGVADLLKAASVI